MKRSRLIGLPHVASLLLLGVIQSWACSTNSTTTIGVFPNLGGSFFQVNALNAAGQLTGYSYLSGNTDVHAYRIDSDRVYLTGHSMGGFGTLSIAMNHPELFAAIAPVAGGVVSPAGLPKIARIPQLLVHGDADRTVPVERSRTIVAAGKKLGAEVKYIEVPGGDHGSVVAPHFKDVFDWFDAHKRKASEAAAAAGAKSN